MTAAPTLHPRDAQLLTLLAGGGSTKEVAAALHLAPGTVMNRISDLLSATGARNRTHLVGMAYRRRWLTLPPRPIQTVHLPKHDTEGARA